MNDLNMTDQEMEAYLKKRKEEINKDNMIWEETKKRYAQISALRQEFESLKPEGDILEFEDFCRERGLLINEGGNQLIAND